MIKFNTKILLFLITMTITIIVCDIACAILTDNLHAYYSFDNQDARDDYTGSYNGTSVNAQFNASIKKVGNYSFGKNIQADRYIYIQPGLTLQPEMTISFWAYTDTYTDIVDAYVSGNMSAEGVWPWITLEANHSSRCQWDDDLSNQKTVWGPVGAIDTWYHYTAVLNGTGMYFYRNGNLIGSSASGQTWSLAPKIYFGTCNVLNQWYNDGYMDELGLWTRDLTAVEVAEVYDCGNTNTSLLLCGITSNPPVLSNVCCQGCVGDTTPCTAPFTTTDNSPTMNGTTDINSDCRMYTSNLNYSTMPAEAGCSGNGTLNHICTLNESAGHLVTDIIQNLYIACAATSGGAENATSSTPNGLEMDEWSLGIDLHNNMTVSNNSNPVTLNANLTFINSDYGTFTILTNFTIDGWILNLSGGKIYKPDGYKLYIRD